MGSKNEGIGMSEREIKTRKPHICDSCGGKINSGEIVLFGEGKDPKYEDIDLGGKQIGIEYYKYYICRKCLHEGNPGKDIDREQL